MKTLVTLSVLVAALILAASPVQARRGNPVNAATLLSPKNQYYIIDSDETDDPTAPTYRFVDTLYDTTHWHRVTNFTNNDDGYGEIGYAYDSILFTYMDVPSLRLPPRYISTNGMLKLTLDSNVALGFGAPITSPTNGPLPTVGANGITGALVCPLWADMEFRTTGDSSKVFYRMTADSCYVTYYNLFLKGSNGGLRATFQIVFSKRDSSITFHYRSFDGTYNNTIPAAQIFQDQATIGVQNNRNTDGSMYLDRGTYYAISSGSQLYAKPLHAGLAVRFERVIPNRIRMRSIDTPPYDGYELLSNSLQPQCTVENLFTTDEYIWVKTTIIDLSTGLQVASCTDSVYVLYNNSGNNKAQFTACLHQGFPCGKYRMTMTASVPNLGTDPWTQDNIMTRDFELINTLAAPFYDNFDSSTTIPVINPCNWHTSGATWVNASSAFFDPPSPNTTSGTGSVLLNRRDANGNPYLTLTGSDSMVSSPIDIHGLTNVWLSFSYQRGLNTDSMIAGIKARVLIGPEPRDFDSLGAGGVYQGDSLLVEGLLSSAPKLNDTAAGNWSVITTLYGGLDYTTQRYRVQLDPTKFVHDHFRIRIRLMAKDDHVKYGVPIEDDDNWLIDNVQVSAPANGQTDLELMNITLGTGNFTHVPRNVKLITPVVTVGNNGLLTNAGAFVVHVKILDALNRAVYDKTGTIVLPAAHVNSVLAMPVWDISGSQGGTFTAKVNMAQNWNEYYRKNDTISFFRTLYIDSTYALDDGVPDAAGTMTTADNSFYYDFTPLADDSLRGMLFYHSCASGNTNWIINIIDTSQNNKILRTIAFSYNVLTGGFIHSPIVPFFMKSGQMYRLQCTMTQGTCLGGDASYGLMWETTHSFNNPTYAALHQDVVSSFRTSSNVDYFTANKNATGGGPLLPMIRLKFAGSSTFLPVELMSFSGVRTDHGSVSLAFQTAKEDGVDHFAIDRESSSGWISAGNIPAKNERLGASYSLLDEQAPSTTLTYRLMEIDLDGTQKLIGTTAVGAYGSPEAFGVQVYPNPASQNLHVTISGTEDVNLTIFDVLGKVVASKDHATNSVDFDVSSLSAGSYWLDAKSGENHSRIKVSVTR